jgi:hypothetical protein
MLSLLRESEGGDPKEGWNQWTQVQVQAQAQAQAQAHSTRAKDLSGLTGGKGTSYADVLRRMVCYVDWPRPRDGKSPKSFPQVRGVLWIHKQRAHTPH